MTTKTLQSTSVDSLAYRDSRYSGLVRPFLYIVDILLIVVIAALLFSESFDLLTFSIFIGICWVVVSMQLEFYEVKRNTTIFQLTGKLVKQTIFFVFITFAFFGYYYEIGRNTAVVSQYITLTMLAIATFKVAVYLFFKNYRKVLGGNLRHIIMLGKNDQSEQLEQFFLDHADYGYKITKHIDIKNPNFSFQEFKETVLEEKID
ncbi:MAG: undecaprenyl-phosphate glucose phosphotransferase, partial [Nonlabens sp.]|nr:undecaprenyl-phosphate glucose phosphotransferase [Nonlabens sp.]